MGDAELGASAQDRLAEPIINTPHGLLRTMGKETVEILDPETGWWVHLKRTKQVDALITRCAAIDIEVRRHAE